MNDKEYTKPTLEDVGDSIVLFMLGVCVMLMVLVY